MNALPIAASSENKQITSLFIDVNVFEYIQGDSDAAVKVYTRAEKRGGATNPMILCLGVLYFKLRNYEDAVKAFSRVFVNTSDDRNLRHSFVVACYNRALCHFRLGNDKAGLDDLERALKSTEGVHVSHSEDLLVREMYAIALRRSANFQQAIAQSSISIHRMKEREQLRREKLIADAAALHKKLLREANASYAILGDNKVYI